MTMPRPLASLNRCNRIRDEKIVKLALTMRKSEVARQLGMSWQNVHYVVRRETQKGIAQ